jgi:hypothetical protein
MPNLLPADVVSNVPAHRISDEGGGGGGWCWACTGQGLA